jgi:hypothetical protein
MAARHTTLIQSDTPVNVVVDSSTDQTWFRIFRALVHGGHLAQLTPAATKVLIILAECVNDTMRRDSGQWIAWPSLDTIAARAGCSRKAVTVAVSELETRKLLRRRQGGGRHTTQYELIAPSSPAREKPVASAVKSTSQPAVKPASQTAVKTASRHARTSLHSTGEAGFPRQRKTTENQKTSSRAATVLEGLGVGEPTLSRLLENHSEDELLLRIEDWNTRKEAGQSKPVAWLIASVFQRYDLHAKTLRKQEELRARELQMQKQAEAELQKQAAMERERQIEQQVDELFDSSSEAELEHWSQQVATEYPGLARHVPGADVRSNRKLCRLIKGLMSRQFAGT